MPGSKSARGVEQTNLFRFHINPRILYTFISAFIVIVGSVLAIRYAEGYRPTLDSNSATVEGTGLFSANSFPSGASIYLNDKLFSATDTTANLPPGTYKVEISKDGYAPWQKTMHIEQKLVTQTNAQLFRLAPGLNPLTFNGAENVSPSPDGQKLLFYTASASAKPKNGLYIIDLGGGFLNSSKEPVQIAEETTGFDFKTSYFIWSPDSSQVLLSSNGHDVLLDINKMNNLYTAPDVGVRKKDILSEWESQMYIREREFLGKFPTEIIQIATESAKNVYLSPDKKRLVYVATAAADIPENISPSLPSGDNQVETRHIEPGNLYVYDREEDKNFLITTGKNDTSSEKVVQNINDKKTLTAIAQAAAQAKNANAKTGKTVSGPITAPVTSVITTVGEKILLATDLYDKEGKTYAATPSSFERLQASTAAQTRENFRSYYSSLYSSGVQWFSDSKHLLFTDQNKIYLVEYDNTNKTAVYSGPFIDNFVFPWPDGSRLIILTSFSSTSPTNLYAIELK